MPRLLPRLLKYLTKTPLGSDTYKGPLVRTSSKQRSLWKPRDPHSSPLFLHRSTDERKRSLLQDPEGTNLLLSPEKFRAHKSLPPKVTLNSRQRDAKFDHDQPREMTEEERSWWANPYLRMISSPLRACIRSKHQLPSDLLLRMEPVQLPSGKKLALAPHGIQHPRFDTRSLVLAKYIACNKEVVRSYLSSKPQFSLEELQIGQLLRLRVLQELEMLAARLAAAHPEHREHTILRRLTRDELAEVKSESIVPWDGAVCVLVLPPPNRDKETKTRPPPLLIDRPPVDFKQPPRAGPPPFKIAQMCYPSASLSSETFRGVSGVCLPRQRIPLYHGVALFPDPSHRAAIHEKLCQILKLERKARLRHLKPGEKAQSKWSHAFLLNSNAKTLTRADSVPLAIALWRLKLWEGGI